ncbi:hypothetical protein ACFJIW_09795 [Tahibacter sp. UC22_41]|uniref:hypothetical protein n=1 Tax=Tahibacter sp. UC22_41 TaxID=3350178 RepID=UPI0036DACB5E
MNLASVRALAFLVVLWIMRSAAAACPSDDPAAVSKLFYAQHAEFSSEDPAQIKEVVTRRLFDALDREHKCAQGQICALEADPWMDAQDGKIGKPVEFATVSNSGTEAAVSMTYPFVLDRTPRQQRVTLLLQRDSSKGCWLLNDLVGPHGDSLVGTIEKWFREYGDAL